MNFLIWLFFLAFGIAAASSSSSSSSLFTNVYATDAYADVIKIDKHASFAVPFEAIDDNTLTKSVRNNLDRQAIVVMLSESFFNDNTYSVTYKVLRLADQFEETTGMPLQYVMTAQNRAECEEYARAFHGSDVILINNFHLITAFDGFPDRLTGVSLIQFDNILRNDPAKSQLKRLINKEAKSMRKYMRYSTETLFNSTGSQAATVQIVSNASGSAGRGTSTSTGGGGAALLSTLSGCTIGGYSSLRSTSASSHEILTQARPIGAFTLLFKGIQHFELVNIFGLARDSAFLINYEDMVHQFESIRKALQANVKLVLEFDGESLRAPNPGTALRNLAHRFQFCFTSGVIGNDLSTALRTHSIKEIKMNSQFDPDNVEEARFRDFVLVDLIANAPVNTLKALGRKLNDADLNPFPFTTCADPLTPAVSPATMAENVKITNFRQRFANRGYNNCPIDVSRIDVFPDSFYRFSAIDDARLRDCFFTVSYQGESGIDAGGLTSDWFALLAKQMFNPHYALFLSSETDQNVFIPNKLSSVNVEHLDYFRFVGRFIAKGIIENIQLDCHFSRSIYKLMLTMTPSILDLQEVDGQLYQSLSWILENDVTEVLADTTFSVDIEQFGEHRTVDLIANGSNEAITEANKFEYVRLMIKYALETSIGPQVNAFLDGFHRLIPRDSVPQFRVKEFEKLISGSPTIDVADWRANTQVSGYSVESPQIIWFWQAVESFSQAERRILLKYATGSPSVPPEGFSNLRSRGQICIFKLTHDLRGAHLLPEAHTCYNRLDIPRYPSYDALLEKLRVILRNADAAFGMS